MLTESEREWFKRRQFFNGFYTTSGCLTCSLNETLCDKADCLLHPDLEDALEFSERVAEKLAYLGAGGYGLGVNAHNMMMYCRLAVEEEMNADEERKRVA